MNTYITLACLLAVAAVAQGSAIGGLGYGYGLGYGLGYGYGGYGVGAPLLSSSVYSAPILAPAAISTANVVKAAPIPVIRTIAAPIYTAPIIKTVAPVAVGSWGYGGYGLGGYGGYGLGGYGGYGGWGGYGAGWGGYGAGWGSYGAGWGGYGKH